MTNIIIAIVIVIIILALAYYYYKYDFDHARKNCNGVDFRCYPTVSKYSTEYEASEMLAKINLFCLDFMKYLRNKYIFSNVPQCDAKRAVELLLANYNPDGIIENDPHNDVNTSFVDDKGKVFGVCLREKKSGKNKFHNMNIIKFVVLHELSHMATTSFGHEPDFWIVFKMFLHEAEEAGMYTPVNYEQSPINYCHLDIQYNPYYDIELPTIKL